MATLWFGLVAIMIAGYVLLDGYDIGAGVVQLLIARTEAERGAILRTVGPVWGGNEVWLLAGGGTLYFAFPPLYAASFSGFYLPLMIVLWLLILRGISIEFRNHVDSPIWRPIWDTGFACSSLLLAIFFGAALGNVVRGVPLDSSGYFFLPLWNDLRLDSPPGILDWYTILSGVAALLALTMHGAFWVAFKTDGPLHERARSLGRTVWWGVVLATFLLTIASFSIQPLLGAQFKSAPWGFVFLALAISGLAGIFFANSADSGLQLFLFSGLYLLGMLTSVVFGVYPNVLPARPDPGFSLTIYNSAADHYGLAVGLAWWIPGMLLAIGYSLFMHRRFSGKITVGDTGH